MTELLAITSGSIHRAATIVRTGGLVIYPTDTVYGLGCDPFNEEAVNKLAATKQRRRGNLPVLVASLEKARELGNINHEIELLLKRFWPGPLTIVVSCRAVLPVPVIGYERMIGLRIPKRPDALELIEESGGSLIGTSANISGTPSLDQGDEAFEAFRGKVDIVLNGGALSGRKESTVVEAIESRLRVLREGAIPWQELSATLPASIKLEK